MDAQTRAGTIKILERIDDRLTSLFVKLKRQLMGEDSAVADPYMRSFVEGFEDGLREAVNVARDQVRAARHEGIPFDEPVIMGRDQDDADGILYQVKNQREQHKDSGPAWSPERRQFEYVTGRYRALELIDTYAVRDNIRALEAGHK